MEIDRKKKSARYVGFADGRDYEEVENLLSDLRREMPEKVRGKMSRGVLWLARHYVGMCDDLDAALLREKELKEEIKEFEKKERQWRVDEEKYLRRLKYLAKVNSIPESKIEEFFNFHGI